MSEARQIAVVRSNDDLLALGRAQAGALGLTYDMLDRYTAFTDGFWSKILAACAYSTSGKRGAKRNLSPESFDAMLVALCFDLVAVESPEKVKRLKGWMERNSEKRVGPATMRTADTHKGIVIKLSLRHMRKLSKLAAAVRLRKIPRWKRSMLARKAARARWAKPAIAAQAQSAAHDHRNSRRTAPEAATHASARQR